MIQLLNKMAASSSSRQDIRSGGKQSGARAVAFNVLRERLYLVRRSKLHVLRMYYSLKYRKQRLRSSRTCSNISAIGWKTPTAAQLVFSQRQVASASAALGPHNPGTGRLLAAMRQRAPQLCEKCACSTAWMAAGRPGGLYRNFFPQLSREVTVACCTCRRAAFPKPPRLCKLGPRALHDPLGWRAEFRSRLSGMVQDIIFHW